ncbi:MAG: type II toxin-antitoxin system HipA family toxin [Gemmatimonadota bacterium]
MNELRVLADGELLGAVAQRPNGDLVLTYDRSWRERGDSFPLSLSMPLSQREHGDRAVRPFMENLLPDSAPILERWARQFHVSARNPFSLLAHMGEDCAGAVQFVRPERYEEVVHGGQGDVQWLTEEDIAVRLRELVGQHGTGRLPADRGQFSLAGAQPKMPLVSDGERWGIPAGRMPTTHILKPPAQRGLDGFDVNEHLCLRLARELGLAVVESHVQSFAGEHALVVARYDRLRIDEGRVMRLHQEDSCQALGVSPLRKYESEGGPGPAEIVKLLLRESDAAEIDVAAFLDALALNWVIGGTDAHAKNYSLLLSAGSVRLAPLYDLISVLPYPHRFPYREAALAMRIDREYRVCKIRRRHWEGLAARCDLDPGPVIERVGQLVAAVPAALERAAAAIRAEGVHHGIVEQLEVGVREHSQRCQEVLGMA